MTTNDTPLGHGWVTLDPTCVELIGSTHESGQRWFWSHGKRTHADDIVDDIARRSSLAQQRETPGFMLSAVEYENQRTLTGKTMMISAMVVAGVAIVRVLLGR